MLAPTFILDYKESFLTANYLFCPIFGERYYYIEDREIEIGKKIVLHCKVDPLMSWKTGLLQCKGTITRSESIGGPTYVPDSKFPIDPNRREILLQNLDFLDTSSAPGFEKTVYVRIKHGSAIWPWPQQSNGGGGNE